MIRKMHRVNGPDFNADALKRKDRRAVSNVPVGNAGLNRHNGQGHGQDLQMTKIDNCQWVIIRVLTLMEPKLRKATADPEMFRTNGAIAETSHGVVAKHLHDLMGQLAEIIRSGNET